MLDQQCSPSAGLVTVLQRGRQGRKACRRGGLGRVSIDAPDGEEGEGLPGSGKSCCKITEV